MSFTNVLKVRQLVVSCCNLWSRVALHPIYRIEQCQFLEQPLGKGNTVKIITGSGPTPSNTEIKERFIKDDIVRCRSAASEHASLWHFNHICQRGSWMALWNATLKHGYQGTVIRLIFVVKHFRTQKTYEIILLKIFVTSNIFRTNI